MTVSINQISFRHSKEADVSTPLYAQQYDMNWSFYAEDKEYMTVSNAMSAYMLLLDHLCPTHCFKG